MQNGYTNIQIYDIVDPKKIPQAAIMEDRCYDWIHK